MTNTTYNSSGDRLHLTLSHPTTSVSMPHESLSDRRMSSANEGIFTLTTLILRKLPRNTTIENVRTMLLFAKDLKDTEMIANEYQDDGGYATALARFSNLNSASEAQTMLDGKPNTAGQANMIVEIISNSSVGSGRRNTMDPSTTRASAHPISPPPYQKASRFNGTFQSIEKPSPTRVGSPPDPSHLENGPHMQNTFSQHSPPSLKDRSRVTGKSVIGEDVGDDETGELLRDPVAYMKNGNPGYHPGSKQQANNPRMPVAAFGALSLNTSMNGPPQSTYAPPRSGIQSHHPASPFSPLTNSYQNPGNQYMRHNYPPVNPADQNPPCNTLYVGNLPMDTSEDELKAMFSKQRGYKRLCFRTKQNGPMCFVEFEDVSFATKALNELYGVQLHNSIKGGIRLSFSKNPLGVRSGQPGGATSPTPMSPGPGMMSANTPMSPASFSAVNGPPPGLSAPPGLNKNSPMSSGIPNNQYATQGFPIGSPPLSGMSPGIPNNQFTTQGFLIGSPPLSGNRNIPNTNGYGVSQVSGGFSDHMLGR